MSKKITKPQSPMSLSKAQKLSPSELLTSLAFPMTDAARDHVFERILNYRPDGLFAQHKPEQSTQDVSIQERLDTAATEKAQKLHPYQGPVSAPALPPTHQQVKSMKGLNIDLWPGKGLKLHDGELVHPRPETITEKRQKTPGTLENAMWQVDRVNPKLTPEERLALKRWVSISWTQSPAERKTHLDLILDIAKDKEAIRRLRTGSLLPIDPALRTRTAKELLNEIVNMRNEFSKSMRAFPASTGLERERLTWRVLNAVQNLSFLEQIQRSGNWVNRAERDRTAKAAVHRDFLELQRQEQAARLAAGRPESPDERHDRLVRKHGVSLTRWPFTAINEFVVGGPPLDAGRRQLYNESLEVWKQRLPNEVDEILPSWGQAHYLPFFDQAKGLAVELASTPFDLWSNGTAMANPGDTEDFLRSSANIFLNFIPIEEVGLRLLGKAGTPLLKTLSRTKLGEASGSKFEKLASKMRSAEHASPHIFEAGVPAASSEGARASGNLSDPPVPWWRDIVSGKVSYGPPIGAEGSRLGKASQLGGLSYLSRPAHEIQAEIKNAVVLYRSQHGFGSVPPKNIAAAVEDAAGIARLVIERQSGERKLLRERLAKLCGNWIGPYFRKICSRAEELWFKDVLRRAGDVVSVRLPGEASGKNILRSDLKALYEDPLHAGAIFGEIRKYPGMQGLSDSEIVDRIRANIVDLVKSQSGGLINQARKIPVGMNRIAHGLAKAGNIQLEKSAGILAVFSPQKQWAQNVALAENFIKTYRLAQNVGWDAAMDSTLARIAKQTRVDMSSIRGKAFSQLTTPREKAMWIRVYDETFNTRAYSHLSAAGKKTGVVTTKSGRDAKYAWATFANIEKAVKIMESKSKDELSAALGKGQKVRNFFNNIVNPWHEGNFITIDTHQVRGSLLRPVAGKDVELMHVFGSDVIPRSEISGLNGTYAVYHEAAEQAAKQLGLRGNELQSVVWESVRQRFAKLSVEQRKQITSIWQAVDEGRIDRGAAVDAILPIIWKP